MKGSAIAIIGMAGRFPGARNLREFWCNLRDGVESIRSLSDAELLAAGVTAEELARPDYVKRAAQLDEVALFDAPFFGLSPRDAAIMDPQHRHFLECAWEALEDAAHPPARFNGSIGVYAGSGMNAYLIRNLLANRELLHSAGLFQLKQTGNDKDVLATRVSYQFDLRGPSVSVQTACSTSLVAVHMACQSLLNHECDMALAGGVTIEIPHGHGYIYREGEFLSRDGYCRPFDATATGTVFSSGVGLVVLRRLEDALADRDAIRAVILGSAINNDGARKVGYLAPSVEGQAEVIAEALEFAAVNADEIAYVEAHGTGTIIGDPIEIRALTQAFRKTSERSGYCAVGSLKSNVGHMDAAAGVAALIKTVLALEHAQIPPTLHFNQPNPHLELENSPFFVNTRLTDWHASGQPRRAGVTSLGIGGTNAHVILEEAPRSQVHSPIRPYYLLTVSAKTASSAERAAANLAAHLDIHPDTGLDDVAFTCIEGRQAFAHRRAFVAGTLRDGDQVQAVHLPRRIASGVAADPAPGVVFLFPGQGAQHADMGRQLYENELVFREALDRCAELLGVPLDADLRALIYPAPADRARAAERLSETWLTQPALFAVEYALAQWWMSLGVQPAAMLGHSIGEYVAACLAGVFTLQDGLAIAALRGHLMFHLPPGAMLAVSLPATEIQLSGSLSLAAINGPRLCAVSGSAQDIARLQQDLAMQSVTCRRIATSHAFHSAMMEPILAEFEDKLRGIPLKSPQIPYLSNVSGTWIRPEDATDPAYWARHLRQTVRFSDCASELLRNPEQILLEVGPGNALTTLVHMQAGPSKRAYPSLPHPHDQQDSLSSALDTLGQLWTLGVDIDRTKLYVEKFHRRVPLPTYAFDHQRYWVEPDHVQSEPSSSPASSSGQINQCLFYRRVWKPLPLSSSQPNLARCWLLFKDSLGIADQIAAELGARQSEVIVVEAGPEYRQIAARSYVVRPGVRADYDRLIADISSSGEVLTQIVHLWSVEAGDANAGIDAILARCFLSPLFLAQALANHDLRQLEFAFVSNRLQQVFDEPVLSPERAVLFGPASVIPAELPEFTSRCIDLECTGGDAGISAAQILAELSTDREARPVAYRREQRFVQNVESFRPIDEASRVRLHEGGAYLITGGLGGVGLAVAQHLALTLKARLVLVGRSSIPPEQEWEALSRDTQLPDTERQQILRLLEIRSAAGGLLVVQGDVTNVEQMRSIVAQVKKSFGSIDGVFHAAGMLDDGPLLLKTEESAKRVLAPKVHGTLALEDALRDDPLDCFVLFSSISSVIPVPGQADYSAANAFLDAFALSRRGPVVAINWDAWRETGMTAPVRRKHPLLAECTLDTAKETIYASQFSSAWIWPLAEHSLTVGGRRRALFPGTGYLEMAAAARCPASQFSAMEFRDIYFLSPLLVDDGSVREVRLCLKHDGDADMGSCRFSVLSNVEGWTENATGIVARINAQQLQHVDRAQILARCDRQEIAFDKQHRTRQERLLNFGPRWRSLRRILIGNGEGIAEVELDEQFTADVSSFLLHPALLDLATGAAVYLIPGYEHSDNLFLPIAYEKARFYQPLPMRFSSHIRLRSQGESGGEIALFDIMLIGEQDTVLAEIEGFAMRRISDPERALAQNATARGRASEIDNELLEGRISAIPPSQGVQALTTILMRTTPASVIVSCGQLQDRLSGDHAGSTHAVLAPVADSAPAHEDVEATLARWWMGLLGVDHVNPEDDFFALGGHSLVGVRLLARIRKTYRAELQLADLFEARTLQNIANAIRGAQIHPGNE